jgi:hypothetical protein
MNNLRFKKLKCLLSDLTRSLLITRELLRLLSRNQLSKLLKRNNKKKLNQKLRLNQRELSLLNQSFLMVDVKMPLLMLRKLSLIIMLMLPIDLTLMTTPVMLLSLNQDLETITTNHLIKTLTTLSTRWSRTNQKCKLMMKPIMLLKSLILPIRIPPRIKIPTLVIKLHKVMMITLPIK